MQRSLVTLQPTIPTLSFDQVNVSEPPRRSHQEVRKGTQAPLVTFLPWIHCLRGSQEPLEHCLLTFVP